MTHPTEDPLPPGADRGARYRAAARADAATDHGHRPAGAHASASVHVSVPVADRDAPATILASRIRGHDDALLRIGRQLGRAAASNLVLAGAVIALVLVLALGVPCS